MDVRDQELFGKTLDKTRHWITDVMEELCWQDRHKAYQALRAVLHALRDRLTVEEAAQMGAQLPMLIRGFYYEGWDPTGKPLKERHKEEFLARVRRHFTNEATLETEKIVRAVFKVISKHVTEGEIRDVRRMLPEELHSLWDEPRSGRRIA